MFGKILANIIWKMTPPKRQPDFIIGPNKDDPYMRRWWIIPRNRILNIYLHQMMHDDDDRAPHDHPWWSLSLCLDGYIKESELLQSISKDSDLVFRENHIRKGDWKWCNKEYAHFLKLPEGEAWTLFITGPKIRKWGFYCPKGWVPWDKFIEATDDSKTGRGCGELS